MQWRRRNLQYISKLLSGVGNSPKYSKTPKETLHYLATDAQLSAIAVDERGLVGRLKSSPGGRFRRFCIIQKLLLSVARGRKGRRALPCNVRILDGKEVTHFNIRRRAKVISCNIRRERGYLLLISEGKEGTPL